MDEQQYQQAFRFNELISQDCKTYVRLIKNNVDSINEFRFTAVDDDDEFDGDEYEYEYEFTSDAENFTNLGWRLLGRYIASNTHLLRLNLRNCILNNEKMASLFGQLVNSSSIETLDLDSNTFGVEGIRSVIPFLENSPQLTTIMMDWNTSINTESFELVVRALHNNTRELLLSFCGCRITDISVLDTYALTNLRQLNLNRNNIGREGCVTLSNMLQKGGSTLKNLFIIDTGMGDEEAEIIAASLKNNNTLEKLYLSSNNGITEKGRVAFLKLLINVSSIESTYHSNHTLTECTFTESYENLSDEIQPWINKACEVNMIGRAWLYHAVGRQKVIKYQLNSQIRKIICELEGIEYSDSNIFANIEPVLLPKILALIWSRHGQKELYSALIPTAPDLLSYIDRMTMLNSILAKNTALAASLRTEHERKVAALEAEYSSQTTRLTAQNIEVINRLKLIELGDRKQSEQENSKKKRKV